MLFSGYVQYVPAIVVIGFLFFFRYSLPFVWTIRYFKPYLKARLSALSTTTLIRSKPKPTTATPLTTPQQSPLHSPKHSPQRLFAALPSHNHSKASLDEPTTSFLPVLSAQGCDPFSDAWQWKHWATMDDCDISGYLSSSSYPRNLDLARMDFISHRLGDFIRDGGWVSLLSSSFTFHHAIPVLTRYTITTRFETWTDDHIYLRSEFRDKRSAMTSNGEATVFCTAITKHAFRYGKKSIAPWFVLAYTGYSGTSEETLRATNAARSREIRKHLTNKGSSAANPLQAFERYDASRLHRKIPSWCFANAWDVYSWEGQRKENLKRLQESF